MNEIRTNVPLAPLTTLGVGGPARFFLDAATEEDVIRGFSFAADKGVEVFILGGGSNLVISDNGVNALVIRIGIRGLEIFDEGGGRHTVSAGAGEDWDGVVRACVKADLAGLECLSGIPGLVGGTPIQNVGAYGQEVSDTIVSVRCLDRTNGQFVEMENGDCGFAYRRSTFNSDSIGRFVVLGVRFSLQRGGIPLVTYRDLAEHFRGAVPTLHEVRSAVLRIRAGKSMVIDPLDPNSKSAGSFFKNPVVDRKIFASLAARHKGIPHFPAGELVKIPAAWLIERAGFEKGFALGEAGLSTQHTLAIINRGNATAADVIVLKEMIQKKVMEKFGIRLLPEPVFAGFD